MVFAVALAMPPASADPVQSVLEQRTASLVLQQFDLSCGAAALATLLRYQHGLAIDERQVALGLVNRDVYLENPGIIRIRQGFSLLDMKRFTDSLGFVGVALGGMRYEDLLAQAPAIVPITTHGSNHFVVFRGELDGEVLIGDPAFGNRILPAGRFRQAWTRYADYGHVAFAVKRPDTLIPPSRLGVDASASRGASHDDH